MVPPSIGYRPERRCILVLGMHRSGTSALTRVLNLLGADLPKTLMPPAANNNEAGFWESARLVDYHDRLLRELGSYWSDWRALDIDQVSGVRRDAIKRDLGDLIREEYGTSPFFVLKDPRICRLLPFYGEVLSECGIEPCYVISLRNPLAVVASLRKRDGMTLGFACLLWLGHVLQAERGTRGTARVFVSYENLISAWPELVAGIGQQLPIGWPTKPDTIALEIDRFLRSDLQHHVHTNDDLKVHPDVADWVKSAFAALLEMQRDRSDHTSMMVLDTIRVELETVPSVFTSAVSDELIAREQRLAEVRAANMRQAEATRVELASRDREIEHLRNKLAERKSN